MEINDLVLGENALRARIELERLQESLVDGIDTLLLAGGSQASSQHEILGINTSDSVRLSEGELVVGQSTGLIGAKNLNTSERLNGRQLLDDGLLLGEISGTDSHCGC